MDAEFHDPDVSNQPPILQTFKQRYIKQLFILVFFLLAFLGIIMLMLTKQTQKPESQGKPTPTVNKLSPSPNETEGWKNYKNDEIGLTMKYPQNLTPTSSSIDVEFFPIDQVTSEAIPVFTVKKPLAPEIDEPLKTLKGIGIEYIPLANKKTVEMLISEVTFDEGHILSRSGKDREISVTYKSKDDVWIFSTLTTQEELGRSVTLFKHMVSTIIIQEKETPLKTYRSKKLGITFQYEDTISSQFADKVYVKEMNNKICITFVINDEICSNGQFVEVFTKDPNQTLEDAIRSKLLEGKSETDCLITPYQTSHTLPSTFKTVEISYPTDENTDMETLFKKQQACNEQYARTNGMRYFLEDTKHPSKFLFFSIGQYGIPAGKGKVWQDTIQIF